MSVSVLTACMTVYHLHAGYLQRPKRVLVPSELRLQLAVGCPVGAENKALGLCRNRKLSQQTLTGVVVTLTFSSFSRASLCTSFFRFNKTESELCLSYLSVHLIAIKVLC